MNTRDLNLRSALVANLISHLFSGGSGQRLLAVGGIHVFERQRPCKLLHAEPEDAVKDLEWVDALALHAISEGNAEAICGSERVLLKILAPARLEIKAVGESQPTDVPLSEVISVRALLYDHQGRELEVGKFTIFEWTAADMFQVANDRSSGEFGLCDTCFGMHSFRAIKRGKGWISARLGNLRGSLTITVAA